MTSTYAVPGSVNSPVAKPDLDLRIQRRYWPDIIRKTAGDPSIDVPAIHLLAYGPPGTGKSYDFREYVDEILAERNRTDKSLAQTGLQRFETNCTRQASSALILGHWINTQSAGFVWNHGPLALAMLAGMPFILNDIHLASDDILDVLMFACDRGATWSLPNGQVLRHTDGFRMLMSMNGLPVEYLDEPLRDRVLAVPIVSPSKAAIEALDPDVQAFAKVQYKDLKLGQTPKYTYRTLEKFCAIREDLGDIMAAALVCEGDEERARALVEPLLIKAHNRKAEDEDDN